MTSTVAALEGDATAMAGGTDGERERERDLRRRRMAAVVRTEAVRGGRRRGEG